MKGHKMKPVIEDDEKINWDEVAETKDLGPIKGDIPPPVVYSDEVSDRIAASIIHTLKSLPKLKLPEAPPPSREPIKLLEPEAPRLRVIHAGDVDIIASPERIEFLRTGQQSELVREQMDPTPAPVVQAVRVTDKTTAEMEAGKRNLARHTLNSVARPRPPAPPPDSVAILSPTNVPPAFQHLLNKPVVPNKGQGY